MNLEIWSKSIIFYVGWTSASRRFGRFWNREGLSSSSCKMQANKAGTSIKCRDIWYCESYTTIRKMYLIVVLVVVLVAVVADGEENSAPDSVLNGDQKLGFFASMHQGDAVCGGVLVSNRHLLTSGSCCNLEFSVVELASASKLVVEEKIINEKASHDLCLVKVFLDIGPDVVP